MPAGFFWLLAAQFLSGLADHAVLIVAIAYLQEQRHPLWWAPLLKFAFTWSYVLLAPVAGAWADAVRKNVLMGRLSRIDSPAFTRLALAVWRLFADLDLSDAAPAALHVRRVRYVSGDVFNVNPPALRRIPGLFCRNERALIEATLPDGSPIALVPVAAILVASIRLHFLDVTLHLRWRGPHELLCDAHLSRGRCATRGLPGAVWLGSQPSAPMACFSIAYSARPSSRAARSAPGRRCGGGRLETDRSDAAAAVDLQANHRPLAAVPRAGRWRQD